MPNIMSKYSIGEIMESRCLTYQIILATSTNGKELAVEVEKNFYILNGILDSERI